MQRQPQNAQKPQTDQIMRGVFGKWSYLKAFTNNFENPCLEPFRLIFSTRISLKQYFTQNFKIHHLIPSHSLFILYLQKEDILKIVGHQTMAEPIDLHWRKTIASHVLLLSSYQHFSEHLLYSSDEKNLKKMDLKYLHGVCITGALWDDSELFELSAQQSEHGGVNVVQTDSRVAL